MKIFLPLGNLRKVLTKQGLLELIGAGGGQFLAFCTTVFFVGDLIDNHRIFLNIEVTFCIKPDVVLLPLLFPFPLPLILIPRESKRSDEKL